MPYRSINNLIILVVFLVSVSFCDRCFCQEFPYVVPEAPEFDSSGSVTTPQSSGSQSDQKKPFRSAPGVFKPQVEIGSISPSQVPTAPISGNDYNAPVRPGPVRTPVVEAQPAPPAPTTVGPSRAPVASVPPRGQGAGMPPKNDCSQFPMLIAQSKSETEMQMTARHYLTCLMQGGWSMEQAREQVIRTIETAFRAGR